MSLFTHALLMLLRRRFFAIEFQSSGQSGLRDTT